MHIPFLPSNSHIIWPVNALSDLSGLPTFLWNTKS